MTKLVGWFGMVGVVTGVSLAGVVAALHPPAVAAAVEPSRHFTGQLTKPLEAMSASDLSALGARISFTGGAERARTCSGTPECNSGSARTSAHIEAVNQAPISASNIPADGVIITRLENTGKFTERRYGLAPGAIS